MNELDIYNQIKDELEKGFDDTSWQTLFGGRQMQFFSYKKRDKTKFPVIEITIIDPVPFRKTIDSSDNENHTMFDVEIEQYCTDVVVDDNTVTPKEEIGIAIATRVKEILFSLGFTITTNKQLENVDENVYRRLIGGYGVIDNKTNKINSD